MTRGKPDPDWKEKVLKWEASSQSPSAWCKKNQIPVTTLAGWKKRFNRLNRNQHLESNRPFIELKDSSSLSSGVFLECHGVKIHLELGFNNTVLKQCLACLGGVEC